MCGMCRSVFYCSKGCQTLHWPSHKALCGAINYLSRADSVCTENVYDCQISRDQHRQIVKLVGDRCLLHVFLDDVSCNVLYDSGSQVSLLSLSWLRRYFPDTEVCAVDDILQESDLKLRTAINNEIPFAGYVTLKLRIPSRTNEASLLVPFLVTEESISEPILGFNVIAELVRHHRDYNIPGSELTSFQRSMIPSLRNAKV